MAKTFLDLQSNYYQFEYLDTKNNETIDRKNNIFAKSPLFFSFSFLFFCIYLNNKIEIFMQSSLPLTIEIRRKTDSLENERCLQMSFVKDKLISRWWNCCKNLHAIYSFSSHDLLILSRSYRNPPSETKREKRERERK